MAHQTRSRSTIRHRPKRDRACGLTALACRQGLNRHRRLRGIMKNLRVFGNGRQLRRRGRSWRSVGFRRDLRRWRWHGLVRRWRWRLFWRNKFRFRVGYRNFFRNPGFRRRGDCLCYQVLGSHGMRDRYGAIRGIPDPRIRGGSPGPNRRKRARTRPRQPK